jgi:hypothetical protein
MKNTSAEYKIRGLKSWKRHVEGVGHETSFTEVNTTGNIRVRSCSIFNMPNVYVRMGREETKWI